VHRLRDREEIVAAVHHVPLGVDTHVAQESNVRREQLGDAAAVRGGVEMQYAGALQRFGQAPNPIEDSGFDDVGVIVEVLVEQRYAFEQRWLPGATRTADSGQSIRCATRGRLSRQVPWNPPGR
jgi:hypothetical protein